MNFERLALEREARCLEPTTRYDSLVPALEAAVAQAVALIGSGLQKLVGPVRGTLTDDEATVLASLIVASRLLSADTKHLPPGHDGGSEGGEGEQGQRDGRDDPVLHEELRDTGLDAGHGAPSVEG